LKSGSPTKRRSEKTEVDLSRKNSTDRPKDPLRSSASNSNVKMSIPGFRLMRRNSSQNSGSNANYNSSDDDSRNELRAH
jgi:hypothetical protein